MIERKINSNFFEVITGILGSLAGIFELAGILVELAELGFEWVKFRLRKKKDFRRIKDKRMEILEEQVSGSHFREFTDLEDKDFRDVTKSDGL